MASNLEQAGHDPAIRSSGGPAWEVRTGLVSPRQAALAGRDAILLQGLHRQSKVGFTRQQNLHDNPAREVLGINVSALAARGFSVQFAALLNVYAEAEKMVDSRSDSFYLDFYEGGGQAKAYTGSVDPEAEATISVGLVGQSGVIIKSPDGEDQVELELRPAEALFFTNGIPQERHRQTVWNESVTTKIDLIVG